MADALGQVWAVVPAGGSGQRFSPGEDKLLANLAGMPVLARTVLALSAVAGMGGIIVAARPERMDKYQAAVESAGCPVPVHFVSGGETRRDSVRRGLAEVPESAGIVVVHDAARPLIRPAIVEAAVRQVRENPGISALVAIPVYDTVKSVDPATGRVVATQDRSRLWRAQTPQVFERERLIRAHDAVAADEPVTDDVQLVEMAGLGAVVIVPGEVRNLKITAPEDILVAGALLASPAEK